MSQELVAASVAISQQSQLTGLLGKVRPQWQARNLIARVRVLLDVDPSSACQRLFNAAIHDLREKIVIAGIDIAQEAATQNKLPPITKEVDIENYPTAKLIDLAYYMGLFSRAEWRRVSRCYEIRRDLEHEDDEYEAGVEDCVYIFGTCIDVILATDPVLLIKVTDIKDLIEQASAVVPDETLLSDFERAPLPRQEEIIKMLLSVALDPAKPDIIQKNAFVVLSSLKSRTKQPVLVSIGSYLNSKYGRTSIDERLARVAHAAGLLPYLRQTSRKDYFETVHAKFDDVGTSWSAYDEHGDLLRSFIECGALEACPNDLLPKFIKWLVLTYIGTPGGVTSYGNVRHVYYSNSAAPLIRDIFSQAPSGVQQHIEALRSDEKVAQRLEDPHIARRFEGLLDLFE